MYIYISIYWAIFYLHIYLIYLINYLFQILKDLENVVLSVYKYDFVHLKVVELAQRKFLNICDKNQFVLNYMNKYQIILISTLKYE